MEEELFFIDLTSLFKELILNIKDRNKILIQEFRFLLKDEYGPYKPYIEYDVENPIRTIMAVKLMFFMLFKKAKTNKFLYNEKLFVCIKYIANEIPSIIIYTNKTQYNKLIHPLGLGQFNNLRELKNINYDNNDLLLKIYINNKDIDIIEVKRFVDNKWIEIKIDQPLDYYMFKFNPLFDS